MIYSSHSISRSSQLTSDVCIIGAGGAGITLACELDSSGIDVVLLEAAGVGILDHVSQDPYAGTASRAHPQPSSFRRRAFGGTTTIWGGRCVPYDPIDFEQREYVANSGWPIAFWDVARHYPKALAYCDAGSFDFSVSGSLNDRTPTLPGIQNSTEIESDLVERYSLPTNFGLRYRRQLQRSGNVRVITHAQALRLKLVASGNRVSAVEFSDRSGRVVQATARTFVLAMGGIESTRMLLASDPSGVGLGNQSDCVGRYYTCHLENVLGVVRAPDLPVVFDFQKTRDGVYARRKLQIGAGAQKRDQILNIAFRLHYPNVADPEHGSAILSAIYLAKRLLVPEYRRILQYGQVETASDSSFHRHVGNVAKGVPKLFAFSADWTRRRLLARRKLPYVLVPNSDGSFPVEFHAEQTPLRESRISLGADKDSYGVPRVRIDWKASDFDLESICRAYQLLRRELRSSAKCELDFDDAKLSELVSQSWPVGGHHIGTARMSKDPSSGVVDENCAVHELPNLFVASSAVFPTSSHANPTLTIVALSVRLAEHLKDLHGRQGYP